MSCSWANIGHRNHSTGAVGTVNRKTNARKELSDAPNNAEGRLWGSTKLVDLRMSVQFVQRFNIFVKHCTRFLYSEDKPPPW